MTASVPAWLFVANLALTVLLGLIAAYVAWKQWDTAHARALLDIFEKRFELYAQLKESLFAAYGNAATAINMPFFSNVDRVRMLFGPDILEFQNECQQTLVALSILQARIKRGDTSSRTLGAEEQYIKELSRQVSSIDDIFLPYLNISIRNGNARPRESLRVFLLGR